MPTALPARIRALACALAALSVAPPAARAADGVVELNQACAATGCMAGDGPGFPISTEPNRSYVLTSDLAMDGTTTAISLATGTTLDLGGFSIVGPTSCTGTPAVCTGDALGTGISTSGHATIRNGRVAGMANGISGNEATHVERVSIESNRYNGILATGVGWHVVDCTIFRNGVDGIDYDSGSVGGSVFRGNSIWGNTGYGIQASGALVVDNGIHRNGEEGLWVGGSVSYGNNHFTNNNANGTQVTGGTKLGPSFCHSALCP
jgi:hypothetical protein